jgi:hypothetical protein
MKINGKHFILFFILIIPVGFIFGQEVLLFFDERISFERPENATLWEERPQFNNVFEQRNYWQGKLQLVITIYDTQALKNEPPTLMSQSVYQIAYTENGLSRDALLNLFNSNSEFVLWDYKQGIDIKDSHKFLTYNGIVMGETYFHADHIDLKASSIYGYTTSLIVDNTIVNMYFTFSVNQGFYAANAMKEYIISRNSTYYWKDENSILAFYEKYSSKDYKELPKSIQQLREGWELILNTLAIDTNRVIFRK